jgi:hypothetical protein
MELTIPVYAKTISETLKAHRAERPAATQTAPTAPAPRAVQPARRPLGRLFRRETPSTFHRCLAVHMHYAQRASALD